MDAILLVLTEESAEGYLDLLSAQKDDSGFLGDAQWIKEQMLLRGWLKIEDEVNCRSCGLPMAEMSHGWGFCV